MEDLNKQAGRRRDTGTGLSARQRAADKNKSQQVLRRKSTTTPAGAVLAKMSDSAKGPTAAGEGNYPKEAMTVSKNGSIAGISPIAPVLNRSADPDLVNLMREVNDDEGDGSG